VTSRSVFECFGLTVEVLSDDPRVSDLLHGVLPLWRRADDGAQISASFHVTRDGMIRSEGQLVGRSDGGLTRTVFAVGSTIREYLALCAPNHIFIHAGVVRAGETAIVIPGRSFTGKTTLVAELVRAGASYYSDEFAVVDRQGLIHPYPRMLTLRSDPRTGRSRVLVLRPEQEYSPPPVPAGMLVITSYRPGSRWQPIPLSAGEGALGVFDNAVAARSRPAEVLGAARRLASGALLLSGPRGEAAPLARLLLEMLSGASRKVTRFTDA
jgi:hypothetical protein